MKKYQLFLLLVFATLITFPLFVKANNLSLKLAGRILLQVEANGEAYYVHPSKQEMYFLGRPDDAFSVMREQGVGISNENLAKIPVSLDYLSGLDTSGDGLPDAFKESLGLDINSIDSDGDGHDDFTELLHGYNPLGPGKLNHDLNFAKSQAGRILLQVEKNGEAWYVSPENNKRYFLGRPADAFNLMRNLGLGISNDNLNKIKIKEIIIPPVIEQESENEKLVKTIDFIDPDTGKELPSVIVKMTSELAQDQQFGIISMPSIIDVLLEEGYSYSDPKMRVIGPFYQIFPQGESFGGTIDFSFCYFDEDIRGYDENLFYIGKEALDVWENIGGTPDPDSNCVNISLTHAPDYTFAVYAGIE